MFNTRTVNEEISNHVPELEASKSDKRRHAIDPNDLIENNQHFNKG